MDSILLILIYFLRQYNYLKYTIKTDKRIYFSTLTTIKTKIFYIFKRDYFIQYFEIMYMGMVR